MKGEHEEINLLHLNLSSSDCIRHFMSHVAFGIRNVADRPIFGNAFAFLAGIDRFELPQNYLSFFFHNLLTGSDNDRKFLLLTVLIMRYKKSRVYASNISLKFFQDLCNILYMSIVSCILLLICPEQYFSLYVPASYLLTPRELC